jgi:hypothetical protein
MVCIGVWCPARGALAGKEDAGSEKQHHLEFAHPLISEDPTPEKLLRFNYNFFNEPGEEGELRANRHSLEFIGEYAFAGRFSLEISMPYTFLKRDQEPDTDRLDDNGGLALKLPTGNEDENIGSNRVVVRQSCYSGSLQGISGNLSE